MLIKILIALAVIIVLFIIIVATRPSDFRVTRSARMAAPPSAIFPHVNDLGKWDGWSPWAKLDPSAKHTFEGPVAGVGAACAWSGDNKVGEGRMTITESRPNELIRLKLVFVRPFSATNDAEFTLKPEGKDTVVTWSMSGKNNFMFKAVGLFMNCDKMMGSQFEQGLAQMKSVVETPSATTVKQ